MSLLGTERVNDPVDDVTLDTVEMSLNRTVYPAAATLVVEFVTVPEKISEPEDEPPPPPLDEPPPPPPQPAMIAAPNAIKVPIPILEYREANRGRRTQ
jgi:outer membrane biosynthesis protein TonB